MSRNAKGAGVGRRCPPSSGGPKGSKLDESRHGRDRRGSWSTAKFGLVNILESKCPLAGCGQPRKPRPLILREIEAGRDAARLGFNGSSPCRWPHAQQEAPSEKSTYRKSDFLSGLCCRIVDSDLEHGTAFLERRRSRPCSISARVLGFELTIHFEHITGSGQSTSGCDHFVPLEPKVRSQARLSWIALAGPAGYCANR